MPVCSQDQRHKVIKRCTARSQDRCLKILSRPVFRQAAPEVFPVSSAFSSSPSAAFRTSMTVGIGFWIPTELGRTLWRVLRSISLVAPKVFCLHDDFVILSNPLVHVFHLRGRVRVRTGHANRSDFLLSLGGLSWPGSGIRSWPAVFITSRSFVTGPKKTDTPTCFNLQTDIDTVVKLLDLLLRHGAWIGAFEANFNLSL